MNKLNKHNLSVTVVLLASKHARSSIGQTHGPSLGDVTL